jgi:hypothetical protein
VPAPFGDRAAGALHLWRVNVAWQVMRGWYDEGWLSLATVMRVA